MVLVDNQTHGNWSYVEVELTSLRKNPTYSKVVNRLKIHHVKSFRSTFRLSHVVLW